MSSWREYFEAMVQPALRDPEDAQALAGWVAAAKLPFDPDNWHETVEQSAYDVLRSSIVNLEDAARALGGFPFGNYGRWYRGSSNDLRLNLLVTRVAAGQAALDEIADHSTTGGILDSPLMTLHTRADQQAPYLHEILYAVKTLRSCSFLAERLNIAVDRYGHCTFTAGGAVFSFAMMLVYAGDAELLPGFADLLTAEKMAELEDAAEALRGEPARLRRLH